jgi:hypothetical protein
MANQTLKVKDDFIGVVSSHTSIARREGLGIDFQGFERFIKFKIIIRRSQ